MTFLAFEQEITATAPGSPSSAQSDLEVHALGKEHKAEVLAFLAARPVHTVFLAGLIRDNGLVSDLNRGTYYACLDRQGRLEGVALIGHFTLIEARTEEARARFARLAQDCPSAHLILGEKNKVEAFWNYFAKTGRTPRRVCRQLLLEQQAAIEPLETVSGLRLATPNDLPRVLPVYAQMVCQESGVNPLEEDPVGFHDRWMRRIEQGRVWVWTENGRLIFNADLMSVTPEVIYLEGIYVNPDERGKGYGLRCLSQLSRNLLQRAKSLCILVNERNQPAQAFYQKAGYRFNEYYDTIYLHLKN